VDRLGAIHLLERVDALESDEHNGVYLIYLDTNSGAVVIAGGRGAARQQESWTRMAAQLGVRLRVMATNREFGAGINGEPVSTIKRQLPKERDSVRTA
jgi:hypothetical protein